MKKQYKLFFVVSAAVAFVCSMVASEFSMETIANRLDIMGVIPGRGGDHSEVKFIHDHCLLINRRKMHGLGPITNAGNPQLIDLKGKTSADFCTAQKNEIVFEGLIASPDGKTVAFIKRDRSSKEEIHNVIMYDTERCEQSVVQIPHSSSPGDIYHLFLGQNAIIVQGDIMCGTAVHGDNKFLQNFLKRKEDEKNDPIMAYLPKKQQICLRKYPHNKEPYLQELYLYDLANQSKVDFGVVGAWNILVNSDESFMLYQGADCKDCRENFRKAIYQDCQEDLRKKNLDAVRNCLCHGWHILDIKNKKSITLDGGGQPCCTAAIHPHNKIVALMSTSGNIRYCCVITGECIAEQSYPKRLLPTEHQYRQQGLSNMAFSPNGAQLAVSFDECTVFNVPEKVLRYNP